MRKPMVRKNGPAGAEYVLTPCRMPPEVHTKLVESANANARSLNAELLHRLCSTFEGFVLQQAAGEGALEAMAADIKALRQIAEAFAKGETHVHTVAV